MKLQKSTYTAGTAEVISLKRKGLALLKNCPKSLFLVSSQSSSKAKNINVKSSNLFIFSPSEMKWSLLKQSRFFIPFYRCLVSSPFIDHLIHTTNPILRSISILSNTPVVSVFIFSTIEFHIVCKLQNHLPVFRGVLQMPFIFSEYMLQLRIFFRELDFSLQGIGYVVRIVPVCTFVKVTLSCSHYLPYPLLLCLSSPDIQRISFLDTFAQYRQASLNIP